MILFLATLFAIGLGGVGAYRYFNYVQNDALQIKNFSELAYIPGLGERSTLQIDVRSIAAESDSLGVTLNAKSSNSNCPDTTSIAYDVRLAAPQFTISQLVSIPIKAF